MTDVVVMTKWLGLREQGSGWIFLAGIADETGCGQITSHVVGFDPEHWIATTASGHLYRLGSRPGQVSVLAVIKAADIDPTLYDIVGLPTLIERKPCS